ncbi:Phosphatidylinositol 4-phosphate 5-kinase [Vigna angularis]|uniref:1-phosphatidylinositol-4-phosphate 5-kinase n=1 Tax=Phaseolus angularis TaxID=3914 RepID=A0A8T0LFJ4_PHAAN|nr:Phosphatidylinositol 4-phosphate 5-kinase [Vigna angularis]
MVWCSKEVTRVGDSKLETVPTPNSRIFRLIMVVVPVSELTTGHNSVIKVLKAEMNFLIISYRFEEKSFPNGDVYIGKMKDVLPHGKGKYTWSDGTVYEGDWVDGKMTGKGVITWPRGAKYEGEFCGGYLHGHGTFTHSTGCIYTGGWRMDAHHGIGRKTYFNSDIYDGLWKEGIREGCGREYMQGVLNMERIRHYSEMPHKNKRQNKLSVKPVKKSSWIDIFGGRRSYYLKLNLQLGIRYTVGKITPVPAREVRSSDFGDRARIRMYFPKEGSQLTPPHCSVDFYWKDYCPMVFRNLREMFKLDAAEYMMSICGDSGLRDISSPGKSGSIFFLSQDDRFVIKTLKKYELKTEIDDGYLSDFCSSIDTVMLNMLPKYYHHVGRYENTLITKFFGLHRITLRGGKKVRFVVMGNMFCTELHIHRRYDLKGSSQGRYTKEEKINSNTTLKDLDLKYEFHMDKKLRESLFKAPENLKALVEPSRLMQPQLSLPSEDDAHKQGEQLIIPKGLLLVAHEPSFVNTAPGPHIRGNTLRAYSIGDKEVDLLLPGTARLRVQLGVNMPAQATRKVQEDKVEESEVELFEVYDVVLYMGIIDILQEYTVKKKLEHACKSLQYDPMTISVVKPQTYAERFINFMEKRVFPEPETP